MVGKIIEWLDNMHCVTTKIEKKILYSFSDCAKIDEIIIIIIINVRICVELNFGVSH